MKLFRLSVHLRTSQQLSKDLENAFELDEIQTQAIVSMRLGQLSGLERTKIEDELGQLNIKIADFKDILQNSERLLSIIKEEALAIKKKI